MMTPRERPIIFSGPMVRAILADTKVQTRRPVKPQPPDDHVPILCGLYSPRVIDRHGEERPGPEAFGAYDDEGEWGTPCPYGGPGNRLWVRETWSSWADDTTRDYLRDLGDRRADLPAVYRADFSDRPAARDVGGRAEWHSPMHMPRWASRLTLDVVSVRVERVQSISEEDIAAEGVTADAVEAFVRTMRGSAQRAGCDLVHSRLSEPGYRWKVAWSLLRGHESWAADPWCWVIVFRRTEDGNGR